MFEIQVMIKFFAKVAMTIAYLRINQCDILQGKKKNNRNIQLMLKVIFRYLGIKALRQLLNLVYFNANNLLVMSKSNSKFYQ